ncbi:MAG: RHS repeat-associated core domain-containing protein [Methylotenera sp.]
MKHTSFGVNQPRHFLGLAVSQIMMNDGTTVYANYTYDANGNTLTTLDANNKGRTLTWNSWNMPNLVTGNKPATTNTALLSSTPLSTTSSSFGFVYNASHERVKETMPDGTIITNMSPRVDTGIHIEVRTKANGDIALVSSMYAGSMPFGQYTIKRSAAGVVTNETRYYHTDHLGSIVAVTDEAGNVKERRSYDAWGKRRNLNGTAMANAFVTPDVRHAFTGHEDLAEVGLIHMNGRLYDAATGRFLSADPTIQFADDMQNYNRYSYINNNPLSGVDHSGYGFNPVKFVKKVFKAAGKAIKSILSNKVVRIVASIAIAVFAPEFIGSTNFLYGALNSYASVIAGGLSGLVGSGGDLRGAISGALTAGAYGFAGDITNTFGHLAAHAAIGCASAAAGGGKCGSGALSGGFSAATAGFASGFGRVGGTVVSTIIGGTASVLGGGKFENGAVTGAFGYLFNCMAHPEGCGGRKFSQSEIDESVTFGSYSANSSFANSQYPNKNIPWYGVNDPSGYLEFQNHFEFVTDFVGFVVALRHPEALVSRYFGYYSFTKASYQAYTRNDALYLAGPLIGHAAGASMMTTTVSKANSLRYGTIYGTVVDAAIDKKP